MFAHVGMKTAGANNIPMTTTMMMFMLHRHIYVLKWGTCQAEGGVWGGILSAASANL